MDFYEVIDNRRSIRAYTPDPVPGLALERIANAVYAAPSACNRQPYHLMAVINPEIKAAICEVSRQEFLRQAPVILVLLGDPSHAWQRPGDDHTLVEIDAAIAMEHAVLAATAEGLGTCWVAAFDVEAMNKVLDLTPPWRTLALSPLGYPAAPPLEFNRPKSAGVVFEIVE